MKITKVILSPEAEEVYKNLNKQAAKSKVEKTILNALNKKIELIKVNPHYGDPIAKNLIPTEYAEKYDVKNLFRVELPNYWRMLYTLTDGETEVEIISVVIDVLDHNKYNKKFRYKNK